MNIENTNRQKEETPKVSVVIPVYNTGKYVREAIDSIRRQTLKELEIIVVNDGSTDNSQQIIDELAAEDRRIQSYSSPNQGVSIARNTGIDNAHGKYIYFMDSDDLLEEDALEICYGKCETEQLDFVFFGAVCFYEDTVKNPPFFSYSRTDKLKDSVYTGSEAIKAQLESKTYATTVWLHFIRRSCLSAYNLRFYPGIIHEDQLFTALLYLQSKRTACIRRTFFHRRVREGSIMTGRFSLRNLHGYFTVTDEMLNYKKRISEPDTNQIIDLYLSQMLNAAVWQAHVLVLYQRLRLAWICLFKYRQYVSTRTIGVLLFKSLLQN